MGNSKTKSSTTFDVNKNSASKYSKSLPNAKKANGENGSQCAAWSLEHINWDQSNWCSISSSRSFLNFSLPRSKANDKHTSDYHTNKNTRKSLPDISKLSKTYWPVPYTESTFLPFFNIATTNHINKFKIEGLLEKGSYGIVYRVKDKSENRDYALKILSKSQIISSNTLQLVKDEVDIHTLCGHHPFIVECISFWQTHKKICILTEFVSGGELINKDTHFTDGLIKLYVAEIALALDFLHNAGVIYRDLKPENILLDKDKHIKLVDFGFSKWLKVGRRTNSFCGTINYMAPEIFNGQPYGHAVDWWALGVVTCLMMTNKFPMLHHVTNGATGIRINLPDSLDVPVDFPDINQIKCVLPNDTSKMDQDLKDLLLRLLQINPLVRLRSLFALERIALYKGYDFNIVKSKKILPKDLMSKKT